MTAIIFLAALAAAVFVFELTDQWSAGMNATGKLAGVAGGDAPRRPGRRSAWSAILVLVFPGYFKPDGARPRYDIVDLLRRSGYAYNTTGEFYAAAVRTFSAFLLLAGFAAGMVMSSGSGLGLALLAAAALVFVGLRRPYVHLKSRIRKRAAGFKNSMLTGLALLNALLTAGVSVQESLRRTAGIGGAFSNLLGLLVARMEVAPFNEALATTRAHLPDAEDVEAGLFLRSVADFYNRNRPILPGVQGLQTAVHRETIEATEARAALVRQRSGLFGVLAVLGLVITIIAPFAGAFT